MKGSDAQLAGSDVQPRWRQTSLALLIDPKALEGALGSAFVRSEEQIADKEHKSGPQMRWGTISTAA